MIEIWKDVKGYEGLYQVSNHGKVKSVKRKGKNGRYYGGKTKILTPSKSGGYLTVGLSKGSFSKTYLVHRLVADVFIPNPLNKKEINHIDGDKHNNNIDNLEWNTRLENMRHAKTHNLLKPKKGKEHYLFQRYGSTHHNAKKIVQLDLCDNIIKIWECGADIERELGIPKSNICKCCKGERKKASGYKWRYIEPIFDDTECVEIEIKELQK